MTHCWDVFISHASEDKEDFVRPLVDLLHKKAITVWFDELSLRPGDSLRRSIDHAISNSRYGVVVLSPSFFAKKWPQRELDSLTAVETAGGNSILPVWYKVTEDEVRRFSPALADKVAITSNLGVSRIADEIRRVVAPEDTAKHHGSALSVLTTGLSVLLVRTEGSLQDIHYLIVDDLVRRRHAAGLRELHMLALRLATRLSTGVSLLESMVAGSAAGLVPAQVALHRVKQIQQGVDTLIRHLESETSGKRVFDKAEQIIEMMITEIRNILDELRSASDLTI